MNPRPRTRTARIYRFVLSFVLSESGAREGTLPRLVFRFVVLSAPRPARKVSSGQFQTFPTLRAAQRGVRCSTLLTRREQGCRCCWQLKVLPNARRSASPPATRDTDRTSRNRCTPNVCTELNIDKTRSRVNLRVKGRRWRDRPGSRRCVGALAWRFSPLRDRPKG